MDLIRKILACLHAILISGCLLWLFVNQFWHFPINFIIYFFKYKEILILTTLISTFGGVERINIKFFILGLVCIILLYWTFPTYKF